MKRFVAFLMSTAILCGCNRVIEVTNLADVEISGNSISGVIETEKRKVGNFNFFDRNSSEKVSSIYHKFRSRLLRDSLEILEIEKYSSGQISTDDKKIAINSKLDDSQIIKQCRNLSLDNNYYFSWTPGRYRQGAIVKNDKYIALAEFQDNVLIIRKINLSAPSGSAMSAKIRIDSMQSDLARPEISGVILDRNNNAYVSIAARSIEGKNLIFVVGDNGALISRISSDSMDLDNSFAGKFVGRKSLMVITNMEIRIESPTPTLIVSVFDVEEKFERHLSAALNLR